MVKHGLKDHDIGFLAHSITIIPSEFNRVDVATVVPTEGIEVFKAKLGGPVELMHAIYPMFLSEFGTVLLHYGERSLKVYPTYAHHIKYGIYFSKNLSASRQTIIKGM